MTIQYVKKVDTIFGKTVEILKTFEETPWYIKAYLGEQKLLSLYESGLWEEDKDIAGLFRPIHFGRTKSLVITLFKHRKETKLKLLKVLEEMENDKNLMFNFIY